MQVLPQRRWMFSKHALERIEEMGLSKGYILDIIQYPNITFPNQRGNRHAIRDGYSVVYNDNGGPNPIVVSILVDHPEEYVPRKEDQK